MNFKEKYGPWALIAGGSEGIGGAWADYCAERQVDVIIIARNEKKLAQKKKELEERHGVEVLAIIQDLADPRLMRSIQKFIRQREVNFLVYNAALASVGGFYQNGIEMEEMRLRINCRGPLTLSYHFGRLMALRRRGGIVLMSSGAGLIGSPYSTHYGATKAYNIGLAEGLWFELSPHGVDVLSCIAGLTSSPGLASALEKGAAKGEYVMTPRQVVDEAMRHIGKRPSIIAGAPNRRKMFMVTRIMNRGAGVRAIGRYMLKNFLQNRIPDIR